MNDRFASFLLAARWTSAIVALMYHARFLVFADYGAVQAQSGLAAAFYFLTGLGHESFAVFFVVDGILAGHLLRQRQWPGGAPARAAVLRHAGALYAVLLAALVLGAACDPAGMRFFNGSGLYTDFPAFSTSTLDAATLLGNAFMLQPFAVPTFGSNGMLYLLSYLSWTFVLAALFVHAAAAARLPSALLALLAIPLTVVLPGPFLAWGAAWLAGVAVVALGEARAARPPVLLCAALFAALLLASRLAGADTRLLPAPFGAWLIQCKYLVVGAGFALVP